MNIIKNTAMGVLNALDKMHFAAILIHSDDSISIETLKSFTSVANAVDNPRLNMHTVLLASAEDAEFLQVIKVPQIRLYKRGNEQSSIVGAITSFDLARKIAELLRT